jgi:hypothetical protein
MSKDPKFQQNDFIIIFRNGVSSHLACARWTNGDHRAYFHGNSYIGSKEYICAEVQKVIEGQEKAGWTDQQIFPYPAPDDEEPHYVEAMSPEPKAVLAERAMREAWKRAAVLLEAARLQTSNKEEMIEQAHNAMARARELESHDNWYPRACHKLDSLNFEGLNPVSYMSAAELLAILMKCNLKPNRIVRTAETLISLWFTEWAVSFRVECCEDGAFVISTMGLNPTHTEHGTAAEVAAELTSDEEH